MMLQLRLLLMTTTLFFKRSSALLAPIPAPTELTERRHLTLHLKGLQQTRVRLVEGAFPREYVASSRFFSNGLKMKTVRVSQSLIHY